MKMTSRTGLLASPTKRVIRHEQVISYQVEEKPIPNLKATVVPARFTPKPHAAYYNPYPYGCSLLCNHPADGEAKKMLKKAKENWSNDGKPFLFPEEVAAIRAELEQMHTNEKNRFGEEMEGTADSVPEELFRRYTETDSRPLTPAPTLASAHTRASAARRCVTPDPIFTSEIREKTLLVLDLRRSHSQETLSWYGTNQFLNDPPLIRVMQCPLGTDSLSSPRLALEKRKSPRYLNAPGTKPRPRSGRIDGKNEKLSSKNTLQPPMQDEEESDMENEEQKEEKDSSEEGYIKRRGRRRKKRARDTSRGGSIFRTSVDPETLVAGIEADSLNPSARASMLPGDSKELEEFAKTKHENMRRLSCMNIDSFLDYETLLQLRRELTSEMIEFEFNLKRRKALQEALKTIPEVKVDCPELIQLQKELDIPPLNTDLWMKLPRMFSRSSARFEIPMDSREFNTLSSLGYLKEYVSVTKARKLLFNAIFNIFKIEEKDTKQREMFGKDILQGLGVLMGGELNQESAEFMKNLIGWEDENRYDFRTFCGICAFCERVLSKDYFKNIPNKKLDPRNEIERVDFESLERRLHNKTTNENLKKMLFLIKES